MDKVYVVGQLADGKIILKNNEAHLDKGSAEISLGEDRKSKINYTEIHELKIVIKKRFYIN